MLDEINGDFGDESKIKRMIDFWPTSPANKALVADFQASQDQAARASCLTRSSRSSTSAVRAAMVLITRGARNILRNPAVLWLRFAMYVALSLMIGTVWWGVGKEVKAGDIPNMAGVLFFIAAFMAFMSISVLPAFLEDKTIMIKERANGWYGAFTYSLSTFLVALPFIFLLALIVGSICFGCLSLNNTDGRYILFIVNLFVTLTVAESVIALISTVVPFFIVGIAAGAFVFGGFMIVEGFFIKLADIPLGWRWMVIH